MPTEKRKIPKSDKAKRSLYMSANTIKNLPKDKRIEWEGDKTPSGSGESYAYTQSGKAVMGKKKRAIRTPYGDDVDVDIDKHMSFPDKKGGSETIRRKVRGKYKSMRGHQDTKSTIDSTYTKQTRGGKVLKKEQMPETEESKRDIIKEVQEEVVRPKKKKVVKKEPVKTGMVAPKEHREEYKKKAKKWLKDKAEGKNTSEKIKARIKARKARKATQERAKVETDSTVQKQIQSGFGDMLTPSKITARGEAARKRIEAKGDSARKRIESKGDSARKRIESKGDDARKRIEARAKAARKRILGN